MARLVNRVANPFIHRDYLSEARAHEFAHEMAENSSLCLRDHAVLSNQCSVGVCKQSSADVCFCRILPGFQGPILCRDDHWRFCHFISIPYRFPHTLRALALSKGIMPLALSSLHVPWSQAVIITLAYRAITFWVPTGNRCIGVPNVEHARKICYASRLSFGFLET